MTNTPMTFEEWFEAHRKSEWVSESPMPKTFLIWDRDNLQKGWQASQAQQANVIAELVEALELTSAICAGETLSKSTLIKALEKSQAILAKVKGK